MDTIETNSYKVSQDSPYNFNMLIKGKNNQKIYNSLIKTNILNNSFIDVLDDCICFTAETVEPLKDFLFKENTNTKLTNIQSIQLLKTITRQIKYLEGINYTFYGFNIDDILVINETKYIIVSSEHIKHIQDTEMIFNYPFNIPYFSSPEILKLTNLPSKQHYKSCYYSLGALLVFCVLNKNLLVGNEIKSDKELDELLEPIYDTNIYWFLKRCLNSDVNKRVLLLV